MNASYTWTQDGTEKVLMTGGEPYARIRKTGKAWSAQTLHGAMPLKCRTLKDAKRYCEGSLRTAVAHRG